MSKAKHNIEPKHTNKTTLAESLPINTPASLPKSHNFLCTASEDTFTNNPDLYTGKELIGVFWFDSL